MFCRQILSIYFPNFKISLNPSKWIYFFVKNFLRNKSLPFCREFLISLVPWQPIVNKLQSFYHQTWPPSNCEGLLLWSESGPLPFRWQRCASKLEWSVYSNPGDPLRFCKWKTQIDSKGRSSTRNLWSTSWESPKSWASSWGCRFPCRWCSCLGTKEWVLWFCCFSVLIRWKMYF